MAQRSGAGELVHRPPTLATSRDVARVSRVAKNAGGGTVADAERLGQLAHAHVGPQVRFSNAAGLSTAANVSSQPPVAAKVARYVTPRAGKTLPLAA